MRPPHQDAATDCRGTASATFRTSSLSLGSVVTFRISMLCHQVPIPPFPSAVVTTTTAHPRNEPSRALAFAVSHPVHIGIRHHVSLLNHCQLRRSSFVFVGAPARATLSTQSFSKQVTHWHQLQCAVQDPDPEHLHDSEDSPDAAFTAQQQSDASAQTTSHSSLQNSQPKAVTPSEESPSVSEDTRATSHAAETSTPPWTAALWSLLKRIFDPTGFFGGIAVGVVVTVVLIFLPTPLITRDNLLREKVTLFDVILHDIDSSYVDKVDINRLFETGVNSMLGTLDPYTQFENNAQALEMTVKTNGRYAGVGLGLSQGDPAPKTNVRPIIVVSAFEGYAFDVGLRPGDVLHSISGTPVDGLSLENVTDMLRGKPGTVVDVTVIREGSTSPLEFSLPRRSVQIKDVPAATRIGTGRDAIAYIRLQSFAKNAAAEVSDALWSLTTKGQIRAVILDLRGNPGGLLNAAVEVSELFVPSGSTIVSTKGRGLGPGPVYVSSTQPILPAGTPLAILVNGQTASASEIVAGAVQDLDIGVIIGSRTFGKGLVQNVQELPFNTALKYTVGKYYTPSGRCIQSLTYEQGEQGTNNFGTKQVEEGEREEFRTKKGRTVRDGGGIEPDVVVQKRPSFLQLALQRQGMYFQFANRFGATTKFDKLPTDFTITDAIYRDFVKFVTDSNFKYESRFDEAFDQLDEMFKDVGYESSRSKTADLRNVTASEMRMDFVRHEKDLRAQIESAVRFRFQPDSERILAELKNDEQLALALDVVRTDESYSALLAPKTEAAHGNSAVKVHERTNG